MIRALAAALLAIPNAGHTVYFPTPPLENCIVTSTRVVCDGTHATLVAAGGLA